MRKLLSFVLMMALLSVSVIGCGYSAEPLISSHYKTIAVDIFKNKTRYRDFEFVLAEALRNEIIFKTGLRLVRREDAETLLSGTILSYDQHVVTETETDEVREIEVKIRLAFEWKDLRTGKIIHRRTRFTRTADAKFDRGETRRSAAAEVLADVAEAVINDLEKEW